MKWYIHEKHVRVKDTNNAGKGNYICECKGPEKEAFRFVCRGQSKG